MLIMELHMQIKLNFQNKVIPNSIDILKVIYFFSSSLNSLSDC